MSKKLDELNSLMGELIDALTSDETGVSSTDEEEIQEYGENAWYGEHSKQETEVWHNLKIDEVQEFAQVLLSKDSAAKFASWMKDFADQLTPEDGWLSNESMDWVRGMGEVNGL